MFFAFGFRIEKGGEYMSIFVVFQYFPSPPYQFFAGPTPPIIQMPMESEQASTAASPDEAYQPYPAK